MPSTDALVIWTIYDHPSDYPGEYVLRSWKVADSGLYGGSVTAHHADLNEVRRVVPPGRQRIERDPTDDPVILESWV